MKHIIITICLCLTLLKACATDPIPITKEALTKFKTIEELMGIPATYKVVQFPFSIITKGEVFTATCNSNTLSIEVRALINGSKSGDKISFQDVIATKDGRRMKLEGKYFVFL